MRIAIVGTNFISDWFVEAATRTDGKVTPDAVYSRTEASGEAFAHRHGLTKVFTDYEQMLAQADLDAIYIASPTGLHFPQAMAAIEAGKHVLIEKTMTTTLEEAEQIFAAAERNRVVAMEATRNLHAPVHRVISKALTELGVIRYVNILNLQYSSRYDRHREGEDMNAFNPDLGNSSVADIGVYCLEPLLDWLGLPEASSGTSVRLANGFEALGSILLDYGSMLATVAYSKIVDGVTPSEIAGERGAITIDNIAQPSKVELILRGDAPRILWDEPNVEPATGMHFEIEEFYRQSTSGTTDPRWRQISLAARQIMDEHLLRSAQ